MTAPLSQFTLGAVNIDGYASKDLAISYEPLGGETILRQQDGTAVHQIAWTKTRIVITGSGRAPTGLRTFTRTSPPYTLTVPDPEEAQ